MKLHKLLIPCTTAALLFACAKPPQTEIDAAKSAIDAAKTAEAEIYAPDSYLSAENAFIEAQREAKANSRNFALFRSYEKTRELLNLSKESAEKAKYEANNNKQQIKYEAITILEQAQNELINAQEILRKAPRNKGGTVVDIEALKGDLDSIQPMIDSANAMLIAEKYLDAKNSAQTAYDKAAAEISSMDSAFYTSTKGHKEARTYTVWYGTNRKHVDPHDARKGYSDQREHDPNVIHYGTCQVSIPKTHIFGSVGSSWYKRWLIITDDRMSVKQIYSITEQEFQTELQNELKKWDETDRQALIYLHGFNVSFNEAAIRAAQIGYDLKILGVTAFFSWPSKGTIEGYPADEASIEASEKAITEFLVRFVENVGYSRVHLIAHSMGNRGLLRAIQRIQADSELRSKVKFGQICLAAPDVDSDVFTELANVYPSVSKHTTLYISPADKAVGLSKWLHDSPRAGFAPPITIVSGIDTVEVPDFNIDILGHAYFANASAILHDMFDLLRFNSPPERRQRLQEAKRNDGKRYWTILQ